MGRTRLSRRWLPAGLLAAALAGCGGEAPSAEAPRTVTGPPAHGDTIVEASIGDISGLIPNITSDGASHSVGSLIYDGLVRADRDLSLTGELAESWEISKDERTITFHLKRGVRWHDGAPFTARDVEFTYRYMRDPKTPTAYAEDFLQVASTEVVDPYTFRVRYEKPYAPALLSWALWVLPAHLLEEPWRRGVDLRTTPQNRHPIGTGPFRFQEWKAQEKVVLLASPDYHRGRPYLDRVLLRIIPDSATIFLELKARNVDMAGLTPLQFRRQTDYPAFARFFERYRYLSNSYAYLGFNLKDPRFADRRVRRALAHAIDRREIIEGVLLGLAQEAVGPYKPGTWWYTDEVQTFPYDPDRAKELLREAGWRDRDGDGILERDGKPFRFTIRTNQGNSVRIQTAEIIQRRLKAIGIDVNIHVVEWAAFINTFIRKRDFEAIILGWGLGLDPDQYEIWHSSKIGPDQLNHISYGNPEVDRLLESGRRTFNQERRKAIYREFQRVLAEDQPVVFLYVPDALTAVSSRIQGIEPAPAGLAWNFIRWYVPRELQRYTR
ncbi:MAG: peptide-binding protein [candidate division NC10 bacterium]